MTTHFNSEMCGLVRHLHDFEIPIFCSYPPYSWTTIHYVHRSSDHNHSAFLSGTVHRTRELTRGHRGFHLQPWRWAIADIDAATAHQPAGLGCRRDGAATLGLWRGKSAAGAGETQGYRVPAAVFSDLSRKVRAMDSALLFQRHRCRTRLPTHTRTDIIRAYRHALADCTCSGSPTQFGLACHTMAKTEVVYGLMCKFLAG